MYFQPDFFLRKFLSWLSIWFLPFVHAVFIRSRVGYLPNPRRSESPHRMNAKKKSAPKNPLKLMSRFFCAKEDPCHVLLSLENVIDVAYGMIFVPFARQVVGTDCEIIHPAISVFFDLIPCEHIVVICVRFLMSHLGHAGSRTRSACALNDPCCCGS